MRTIRIVKVKIYFQALLGLRNESVFLDVNILVFDRAPEAFDKNIVEDPTAAVHADGNTLLFENVCKLSARELNALICIKDLRFTELQGFLQTLDTKSGF